jgi:serine/threonine-protein kinase RIO1
MRYLGDEEGPAPRLKDVRVERPQEFLDGILADVEKLADVGLVHGDLSPYNVLVYQGEPWFIDFPDCLRVDRLGAAPWRQLAEAERLLRRGLRAFEVYFRNDHVTLDIDAFVGGLVGRLDRRGVLKGPS